MAKLDRAGCPKCQGSGWMPENPPTVILNGLTTSAAIRCDMCVADDPVTPACWSCRGMGHIVNLDFASEERTVRCPRCGGRRFLISGIMANALNEVRAARRSGEA